MCGKNLFVCVQTEFFLLFAFIPLHNTAAVQYVHVRSRFVTDGPRALFWHYFYSPEYSNSLSYGKSHPRSFRFFFPLFISREALFLWDEGTSLPSISFFKRKRKGFLSLFPGGKGKGGGGIFLFSSVFVGRERAGKEKGVGTICHRDCLA